MKFKKITFSLLTLAAVGFVATTLLTSCSGVSGDILNNMVKIGNDDKFADGTSLQDEINIALTDKDATAAFKTSVVNKILYAWFNSLKDKNSTVTSDIKQWDKDINNDWDSQIQSSKNSHLSNWKYYFQNDVLNPVGGTKDAWKKAQWYSKIRDYFTGEITKNSYLSIPEIDNQKYNKDFYVGTNPGQTDNIPLTDFNHGVLNKISNSIPDQIGIAGTKMKPTDVLSPDWWPTINFYAKANASYDPKSSSDQDKSYALLQQIAFENYTNNIAPISTGYVLWNYSLDDGQEDLKKVYNADKILGAADLLKTPSFSFPYFGNTEAGKPGPNQNFSKFASDFTSTEHNEFLVNQKGTSTDTGNLGLINIPNSGYSDSTDATLALINMSSDSSSDNTPFETYVAPLFDIFQQENAPIDAATYVMPTSSNPDATDTTVFADSTNILNNFLFTNSDESTSVKKVPSWYLDSTTGAVNKRGVMDLANLYDFAGTDPDDISTFTNSEIFSHDSSPYANWYKDGARYFASAVRLTNTTGSGSTFTVNPTPYLMIRTAKGVTLEGVDGMTYLKQTSVPQPTDTTSSTVWRPGDAFSQERENQLIKFRTAYQNFATTPTYKGIDVINSSGGSASGPLVDYLKSNIDSIVLDAVNRVWTTKDIPVDTYTDGAEAKSYYDDGLLGINSIISRGDDNNDTWNTKLNDLIQSFNLLNLYSTIISNYDSNNKKLFSYSSAYSTNALTTKGDNEKDGKVSIYKNGLASPLPVNITTGNLNGDRLTIKTNYSVDVNAAKALAKTTGLNAYFAKEGVTIFANNSYDKIISAAIDLSNDKLGGILERYTAWNDVISSDAKALHSGKGNSKAYEYNYSENILTYNSYVNDLLWKFGSTSSFSNSVKTAALQKYINDPTRGGWNPTPNMLDAVASMYLSTKLISSDTPLTSYFNSKAANTPLEFSDYKDGLLPEWNSSLSSSLGSTTITTNDNKEVTYGYNDKAIDYLTYQATILRLTGGKATADITNDSKFVDWIKNKIGTDFQNTAYIAWGTKDNNILNGQFSSIASPDTKNAISTLYGWKNNFAGDFDNIYTNTNIPISTSQVKSYVNYDQYWQFAPLPTSSSSDDDVKDAMGFLGLQTKNSNTLDKISATAKDAIFGSDISASFDSSTSVGTLYQFNKDGNNDNARLNLLASIDSDIDPNNPSVVKINQYVSFINSQTGRFSGTSGAIANEPDPVKKLDILKRDVNDLSILPSTCFGGYNIVNNSTLPTWELRGADGNRFLGDTPGTFGVGSRVRVMQLNRYDVDSSIWTGNGGTDNVVTHLQKTLGTKMVDYLVAQAALDSNQQSITITDVIKTVFNNNKLVVYDRRFNDQLGSQWVSNWKSKN